MGNRIDVEEATQLAPVGGISKPQIKQNNGEEEQLDRSEQTPDTRPELSLGDPNNKEATYSKSDTQFIEIATPTARLLLQIEDHFPFDPWPDFVIVDEIKVSFVRNRPLSSGHTVSILIKDITDVEASSNPIWAELTIFGGDYKPPSPAMQVAGEVPGGSKPTQKGPLSMAFLNKKQAAMARRLIFGLMIMHDRKVDTSEMPVSEVRQRAEDLGRARKGTIEYSGEGES